MAEKKKHFVVAPGKSFRDAAKYFTAKQKTAKSWKAGDDVTGFDKERLEDLINRGLVVEKPEDDE